MALTNYEQSKIWRKRLQEELETLSSKEFQKRAWINFEPGIVYSFTEAVCGYFDDLLLVEGRENEGLDWHLKENSLSKEEVDILRPFNLAFHNYAENIDEDEPYVDLHKKIHEDPEWEKIRKMAGDVLKKIDFDKVPPQD